MVSYNLKSKAGGDKRGKLRSFYVFGVRAFEFVCGAVHYKGKKDDGKTGENGGLL